MIEHLFIDGNLCVVRRAARVVTAGTYMIRVEPPRDPGPGPVDGVRAGDSDLEAADLAATSDGLDVLTFDNEVWRISPDEDLELVLRRGDRAALAALAGGR